MRGLVRVLEEARGVCDRGVTRRFVEVEEEVGSYSSGSGPQAFYDDLALCISAHRGVSPALVWLDAGGPVLTELLGTLGDDSALRPDGHGALSRRDAEAASAQLDRFLGPLIGGTGLHASYWLLATGRRTDPVHVDTDALLLPLVGGCTAQVNGSHPSAPDALPRDGAPFNVRMLEGEALYIPGRSSYLLMQAYVDSVILDVRFAAV